MVEGRDGGLWRDSCTIDRRWRRYCNTFYQRPHRRAEPCTSPELLALTLTPDGLKAYRPRAPPRPLDICHAVLACMQVLRRDEPDERRLPSLRERTRVQAVPLGGDLAGVKSPLSLWA